MEALCELRVKAICEGARLHYSPAQVEAWAERRTAQSYRGSIECERILVADTADGNLAGFAQLDLETGEVASVYVHPASTGRGVGTRLLTELERRARAAGLTQLHLDASLNAVSFYERSGYRCEHEVSYTIGIGIGFTCVFMTRPLE